MAFTLSVQAKMAEAIVLILKADADLLAYCVGGIHHQVPESPDSFLDAPKIMVWPIPTSDRFARTPGNFVHPGFNFAVVLVEPQNEYPIPVGTISTIDRLERVEKELEQGSDGDGRGSLKDPYAAPGAEGKELYLNDGRPSVRRVSPKLIKDAAAQAWPIEVFYPTTLHGETRQR